MHGRLNHSHVIYGGAFDPIHLGHIQTALNICKHLNLKKLYLLPCGQPVFKKGCHATPEERLNMIRLAVKDHPHIKIDTRELFKSTPSYTIDSLKELRTEKGLEVPILFILGQDAFNDFFKWHNWQNILHYCHLIILKRSSFQTCYDQELANFISEHVTKNKDMLMHKPNGLIYEFEAGDYPYSSTQIKAALQNEEPPIGLDKNVLEYILEKNFYRY